MKGVFNPYMPFYFLNPHLNLKLKQLYCIYKETTHKEIRMKMVNINKTLDMTSGMPDEKIFLSQLIRYTEQISNTEDRDTTLYNSMMNAYTDKLKDLLESSEHDNLTIIGFEKHPLSPEIGPSVYVHLKDTAIRFKIRDELNKEGYSVSVKVENGKTLLDVNMRKTGIDAFDELENKLSSMKPWVIDYMMNLKDQIQDSDLPESVARYKTQWKELPDERRILVKVNKDDVSTFKSRFTSAKWERDLKAWRISNLQSNKTKLQEFRDDLERYRLNDEVRGVKIINRIDTNIDGHERYYELSIASTYYKLNERTDVISLDLMSKDGSPDGKFHTHLNDHTFINASNEQIESKIKQFFDFALDLKDSDIRFNIKPSVKP
ncbi:hypothetical protein [Pantoea agglomerans]|uniref:hypothetical protein n=1 Tax=Enterobacter agglomerans TaxID=549 RepID=UPI003C7BED97